jgi:hypothetical protein
MTFRGLPANMYEAKQRQPTSEPGTAEHPSPRTKCPQITESVRLISKCTRKVNNTSLYPQPTSATIESQLDASFQVLVNNLFLSIHTPSRHSERQRISSIGSLLILSKIASSKEHV